MSKFIILFFVAAAVASISKADADADANAEPQFQNFPNFPLLKPFNNFGPEFAQPFALLNPEYVKNLKGAPGQDFHAVEASSSDTSETVNGVTRHKHDGQFVTNDNGKVQEGKI